MKHAKNDASGMQQLTSEFLQDLRDVLIARKGTTKMRLKQRVAMLLGLMVSFACLGTTVQAGERWCDTITITGGTYTITPGYWTEDGVVIGNTWIGGGSISVAGTTASYINFPNGVSPNDFHYGVDPADPTNPNAPNKVPDQYDDGNGNVTQYSSWSDWGVQVVEIGTVLSLPIYASTTASPTLDTDWDFAASLTDPNLTLKVNDVEVYNGLLSAFVPGDFNLTEVGTRQKMYLADVPAVTTWGLIAMVLLVLAAGTVVFRRATPQVA